jgi:predicted glycogen debranching enzyme
MRFGRQLCGDLAAASSREWLVADGIGGFSMGTVGGLRTRRYHGLLMVSTRPPLGRMLALAALDPVLVVGDARIRLGVHEWGGGVVDPQGYLQLASFELRDGLPCWRWAVGDTILERVVASLRPGVAVVHRLVRADGPVRLELSGIGTWRDANGQRRANGDPSVETLPDGYVFEGAYRVWGPGYTPGGEWYRGVNYREEAARGLDPVEDLWFAGTFASELAAGETLTVCARAGTEAPALDGASAVESERARARQVVERASATDEVDRQLVLAADQFVVDGPTVVAGYPWFGEWSRDTMTSYEGLLLDTGRSEEGRRLLQRAAATLNEGMLANTTDLGDPQYNTVDGTLWYVHAVGRHVDRTGDSDLANELVPGLQGVIDSHVAGTRYGIKVDPADGLLEEGAPGVALTWMDARVDGVPITQRAGKAVEINALWINALATIASLLERLGRDAGDLRAREAQARASFEHAFSFDGRLADVVGDGRLRPNQLLAVSLPFAPLRDRAIVESCAPLLTSIGLRSLDPADPGYKGRHRGGPAERDAAYHEGTVWPWLIGPYVEAAKRTGVPLDGVLDGLEAHLAEFGLGSVSETADGDVPHDGTGCPFQAWSVAEMLRATRLAG